MALGVWAAICCAFGRDRGEVDVGPLNRRRHQWRAWFAGLLFWVGAIAPGWPATLAEYQVKAVFLFNFTQFVGWPPSAFGAPESDFVIGVLGTDPFGSYLDDVVRGENVAGHPIVVRRYTRASDVNRAHILFIDRSATAQLVGAVTTRLEEQGTLTVSDVAPPAPGDVVVRFVNANSRIRLRINVATARSSGLVLSSKLLRPAEVVGLETGP
jgi:hypothetical protein